MRNHASEDFHVKRGDRVAQLILERILCPYVGTENESRRRIFDNAFDHLDLLKR